MTITAADGPSVWDRGELAAQRIGGRIEMLFATDEDLYVYFEKLPIISFHRVRRTDNGASFLFWCETD